MKKRILEAISFVLLALVTFFVFRSERNGGAEMPHLSDRNAESIRAAEKESGKQSLGGSSKAPVALKATEVNIMSNSEHEHFEVLAAEWITESYSKNVVLTNRKNKSLAGFKFEWLDSSIIPDGVIQHIMQQIPVLTSTESPLSDSKEGGQVSEPLTKEAALSHVGRSVNMAFPPVKGMEVDGYFLFSGGTTAWAVYDFSTGIAVDSRTGRLFSWESEEL